MDFTFNPVLRTLQQNETVQQLRKKQSDVLALLCAKHPEPVSQEMFLKEVWGGGYVTSQSIAQMIRSLRLSLKDDAKTIIVTIPKLGYQLTAQPIWEAQLPDKKAVTKPPTEMIEQENIPYASQQITRIPPPCTSLASVIPCDSADDFLNIKIIKPRKWFFITVVAFCLSLISVVRSARSYPLKFIEERNYFLWSRPLIPYNGEKISRVKYCCETHSLILSKQKVKFFRGKRSQYIDNVKLD